MMKLKHKEPDYVVQDATASREWKESLADSSFAVCGYCGRVFYLTLGQGSTSMEWIAAYQLMGPQEAFCQWLLNIHYSWMNPSHVPSQQCNPWDDFVVPRQGTQ